MLYWKLGRPARSRHRQPPPPLFSIDLKIRGEGWGCQCSNETLGESTQIIKKPTSNICRTELCWTCAFSCATSSGGVEKTSLGKYHTDSF